MTLRSFWKGSISFGLVHIPVKLYTATEDRPLKFHLLHKRCHTRIQYRRTCPACAMEVPQDEMVRGYPYARDHFIILEEKDLKKAMDPLSRKIEILNFVLLEEIDPIYYDRAYYVVPEGESVKVYALLRDAMKKTGKAAIGHVALREKGHLALLRPIDDAIGLETLYYPGSIRWPESFSKELPKDVVLKPKEMEMAVELMNRLAVPFKPEEYQDTYRENLLKTIQAKIEGEEIAIPKRREAPLMDLTEALKVSLQRTRGKKGERKKTA